METVVSSWDQLIHELYADSWQADLKRHRSPYVFRGCSEPAEELRPGITLIGEHHASVEKLLLSDFRHYARLDISPDDSEWNWLAVAQHHGLPTRLLDWTYSPFVAMHFVTAGLGPDEPQTDGLIWCVNYKATNQYVPEPLRRQLDEYRKSLFSIATLEEIVRDLDAFDALSPDPFVVFLEPPSIDARIVNQVALFSIMSRPRSPAEETAIAFDKYLEWLDERREDGDLAVIRRIRIPPALKWEIRDKLDQANITERVLFPGLDGLAAWLRRHYTKRA